MTVMRSSGLFFAIAALFVAAAAEAAVDVQQQEDGNYYTAISVAGPSDQKYDLVFIGDGFTEEEQDLFNNMVDHVLHKLQCFPPFSSSMCALNIWRVNVISQESGVDHPKEGIFKDTELDCRYGNPDIGQVERCITSDSPAKCYEAASYAPAYNAVFVLVNDTQWGGCAGGLVFSSISLGFEGIVTHELGHRIAHLADEYECLMCDGTDDGRTYTGSEPGQVNLTTKTSLAEIKWNDLIEVGTPIPTTTDNPPGVVGLWEGGGYHAYGIYRPQAYCQMRSSRLPFCAVCEREAERILHQYCDPDEIGQSSFQAFLCRGPGEIPVELPWWYRLCIRVPIGPCPGCPPDVPWRQIEIYYDSLPPGQFDLLVFDAAGEEVAQGVPSETGGLMVSFEAGRLDSYSVELRTPQPTRSTLSVVPRVYQNAQEVMLTR